MFSGKPASNGPGRLEDDLLLLWKLESTLFSPHTVVCLAPQCLYLQGIYHCALEAAVIRTDCWEPVPLLNPEGYNRKGPLEGWVLHKVLIGASP